MLTYERAQELLGDTTIPKDSDFIEEYLEMLDDLVKTNGEQWVKDNRGLLADEWEYVATLLEDAAKCVLEEAIKNGARKVHCFDGFLPEYYKKFGFTETKRVKWDERHAPKKWDYDRLGRPDVVYMELEGVEKNEDKGPTKKEQQESKLGEALVELGYRLEKGHDFDQDYGKAMELYTLASAERNSAAMNNIGWLYLNGLGVNRNLKAAVEWFEKAAQYGNTRAMINLGNICEEYGLDDEGNPDYKGAMKWYTEAVRLGNLRAKLNLGNLYHCGHGVRKNYRKAAEIYKELATSGYVEGCFYMGLYFQNGFHFKQNYDAARCFYEIGAAGNDALSMMNLGAMYSKGLGVEVDHQKALYWYTEAGKRGDTLAYVNIGWFFETGLAVEQDYKLAIDWYKKGAEAREPHAMNNLGAMYERGLGVKKDQKKAEYWYAKAKKALESQPFLESPTTVNN